MTRRHELTYCFSDDPWNQTAADNAEWLQRFKRDVGITKEGPGLPKGYAWALEQGGSGFAPPYAFPKGHVEPFSDKVQVNMRTGAKSFTAGQSAANSFLETLTLDNGRPANVFCSRELETGLVEYVEQMVTDGGHLPSDEALRERAKQIVHSPQTAADDPTLLQKFKDRMLEKLPHALPAADAEDSSMLASNMDVNISDEALDNILQDMDFDFDAANIGMELSMSTGMLEEAEDGGGVSLKLGGPSAYD